MRGSEALAAAQSRVGVTVSPWVNLSAVQFSCQQSAAVASPQPEAASGAKDKRVHACCRAETLHEALMDYTEACRMRLKPHEALTLLGERPAVNAMTVMAPSAEWRQVKQHNSQWPWKAPQGEEKPGWAGRKISIWGDTDAENGPHSRIHTYSCMQSAAIHFNSCACYFLLNSRLNLRDETLLSLYLPWCICVCPYSQTVMAGRRKGGHWS